MVLLRNTTAVSTRREQDKEESTITKHPFESIVSETKNRWKLRETMLQQNLIFQSTLTVCKEVDDDSF
jgi:hypothetical protein